MNKLSWLALVVLTAGCGRGFEETPPAHTQPLPLISCAGLGRLACGARADCDVENLACPAICQDDGRGGCVPCDAFRCVTAPPAPASCDTLDHAACGARSDCRLEAYECLALCAPGVECCPSHCVAVAPPSCSGLDATSCSARPDCRLADIACAQICADDGAGGCLPTLCDAMPRCVDAGPISCGTLAGAACSARPDCRLETPACASACTIDSQGQTSCTPNVCDVEPRCVDAGPIDTCAGLDVAACSARSDCAVAELGCPIDCTGPNCPQCDAAFVCLPAAPPSPCFGLDVAACTTDSRCELVSFACTTECRDDGQGGCLPCTAPPPSCQPRAEEPPVAGCGMGGGQPPQGP